MSIDIPQPVRRVLEALSGKGYAAYIVGGAVRDMVIGRRVKDYDITTAARPEAVIALAAQHGWRVVDKLGQNFGVVLLVVGDRGIEVATFRGEKYGEDSHRPVEVWYADTLEEDLGRRDFTMNAMAMFLSGELIDPFGGRKDLALGVIRTVGEPEKRFAEDALRLFRACRFAAELGFTLDEAALNAMPLTVERVARLSLERVRGELDRLLLAEHCTKGLSLLVESNLYQAVCRTKVKGEYFPVPLLTELGHLIDLPQNPRYHKYDVWRHTLAAVEGVSADLTLRWAALLHDIGKGLPGVRGVNREGQPSDHGHDKAGARLAENILTRLQVPLTLRQKVVWLVENHMKFHYYAHTLEADVPGWVRAEARSRRFADTGEMTEAFRQLALLCQADVRATGLTDEIKETACNFGQNLVRFAADMPVHTRNLHYEAAAVQRAVGDQAQFALFIKTALRRVQDGTLANRPAEITKAAKKWAVRQKNKK